MRVLVTGNLGYIGTVLAPFLGNRGHEVRGLDVGYFDDCLLEPARGPVDQRWRDIRDVEDDDLEGMEAVVHLAGLSNDPLGEFDASLTEEINLGGTLRRADLARRAGVRRFVYASSQSMYGISETDEELDEDRSAKNPLTAYARTKWEAELALMAGRAPGFEVTAMRPSTVFGSSARLRCDIVFNNLVASAYTSGAIEVKSDGTPRRPAVHVLDVCSAFTAGLEAPAGVVDGRAFNVGVDQGNHTVRELADTAGRVVPGSSVVYTGEHGSDSRTYTVGFSRILTELADHYRPEWTLLAGGAELCRLFDRVGFDGEAFRGSTCNRLRRLEEMASSGRLDGDLRRVDGRRSA